MIPRNEIVAVSSDTDRERLRRRFTATGLSKILVYTDDIDNIIGYIHVNEPFQHRHRVAEMYKTGGFRSRVNACQHDDAQDACRKTKHCRDCR